MNELIEQARELCDSEFNAGRLNATLMRKVYALTDALEAAEKELIDFHHTQQVADGKTAESARLWRINEKLAARAEKAEAENQSLKSAISQYCKNDCYRDFCNGNEDVGIPDCPFAIYRPLPEPPKGV